MVLYKKHPWVSNVYLRSGDTRCSLYEERQLNYLQCQHPATLNMVVAVITRLADCDQFGQICKWPPDSRLALLLRTGKAVVIPTEPARVRARHAKHGYVPPEGVKTWCQRTHFSRRSQKVRRDGTVWWPRLVPLGINAVQSKNFVSRAPGIIRYNPPQLSRCACWQPSAWLRICKRCCSAQELQHSLNDPRRLHHLQRRGKARRFNQRVYLHTELAIWTGRLVTITTTSCS